MKQYGLSEAWIFYWQEEGAPVRRFERELVSSIKDPAVGITVGMPVRGRENLL
jgi:hypothetical protein